jgi:hypothetical protein
MKDTISIEKIRAILRMLPDQYLRIGFDEVKVFDGVALFFNLMKRVIVDFDLVMTSLVLFVINARSLTFSHCRWKEPRHEHTELHK